MTGKHSAVMLIVTGLTERATRKELKSIFQSLIKNHRGSGWNGQGTIRSCEIIRITDSSNDSVEYHGLVELQPAKLALLAARELNGTEIGGKPIGVHRYQHRSSLSNQHCYLQSGEESNQAGDDQRRSSLTIELMSDGGATLLPSLFRWLTPPKEVFRLKDPERHTT